MKTKLAVVLVFSIIIELIFLFAIILPGRDVVLQITKDIFPWTTEQDINPVLAWAIVGSMVVAVLLALGVVSGSNACQRRYKREF